MTWIYYSGGIAVAVICLVLIVVFSRKKRAVEPEEVPDETKEEPVPVESLTKSIELNLHDVDTLKVSRPIWISPNGKFFTRRVAESGRHYNSYISGDAELDCREAFKSSHPSIAAGFNW